MNGTLIGLLAGLALGFAGAFSGLVAFVIVLVLGAVGLLVGRWVDGALGPVEPDRLRSGPEPLMAPLMAPPPPGVCTHDHGNAALRGGT